MNFLRTLFWVMVTIVVVVFTMHNWRAVTVDLFGGLQADVKLPLLMLIAFLAGFVPLYAYYRAALWRERRAANARPAPTAPVPTAPTPAMSTLSAPAVPVSVSPVAAGVGTRPFNAEGGTTTQPPLSPRD